VVGNFFFKKHNLKTLHGRLWLLLVPYAIYSIIITLPPIHPHNSNVGNLKSIITSFPDKTANDAFLSSQPRLPTDTWPGLILYKSVYDMVFYDDSINIILSSQCSRLTMLLPYQPLSYVQWWKIHGLKDLGSLHTRHFCTRYCDKKIILSHGCLKAKVSS